jgi:hypothetical protein
MPAVSPDAQASDERVNQILFERAGDLRVRNQLGLLLGKATGVCMQLPKGRHCGWGKAQYLTGRRHKIITGEGLAAACEVLGGL